MIETRAATHDDRPLIFATWLRAFRHGSHFPRHIPEREFFAAHHNVVEALLDRSAVQVAHPVAEPEVILGWSAVETLEPERGGPSPLAVHFVYVKPAFRRAGIARRLLNVVALNESGGVPVWFTHETFALRLSGVAAHVKRWNFNPYLALQFAATRGNNDDANH